MNKNKFLNFGKKALRVASEILPKLPSKNDSPVMLAVKGFAIWDTVTKVFESEEGPIEKFVRLNGLEQRTNTKFIDLFCSSKLLHLFKLTQFPVGNSNLQMHHASSPEFGNIYWNDHDRKNYGWYYVDEQFLESNVCDQIWNIYKDGLMIDEDSMGQPYYFYGKSSALIYNDLARSTDPVIQKTQAVMAEFKDHHKRLTSSKSRCYLFIGTPGTGKSTFAQRFAFDYSNKVLKITSDAFVSMKYDHFNFFISSFRPDFVIVDDIDRTLYSHKLLQIMEDVPKKYPWLTLIFTANKLKELDPALVRPGRIDEVVEFELPNKEERIELLNLYIEDKSKVDRDAIEKVANISNGLSQAWLREVAFQMSTEPQDKLIPRIEKMLAITGQLKAAEAEKAKAKEEAKKKQNGASANGKTEPPALAVEDDDVEITNEDFRNLDKKVNAILAKLGISFDEESVTIKSAGEIVIIHEPDLLKPEN